MELKSNESARQARLNATFAALSDPTRRAILARLTLGHASVAELAEPFSMTQPAISKHLKVLESAGLIIRDRDAQRRPSKLDARPLGEANKWLADYRDFWKSSIKRLDELQDGLKGLKKKGKKHKRKKR
jgi:DNA-binding transcriptional ArsR family regulator